MARTKISEFSATPGNNTDIDSINIAEGCAPSGINDAIRELMAQLKDFQTGAVGDSFNGPVGTTTAAAGAFTTLAASGAVTLSGGTANGVPYLNGSKVLTSGSALTFDGTNLGVGTSSPSFNLDIGNTSATSNFTQRIVSGASYAAMARYDISGTGTFTVGFNNSGGVVNNAPSGVASLWMQQAYPIVFGTSGTERMRLDSSGNLGLGVTPSAWNSGYKALQVGPSGVFWSTGTAGARLGVNYFLNASDSLRYINGNVASDYRQSDGEHQWFTAPGGSAGAAISFTQAMTLLASGELLIGKTAVSSSTAGLTFVNFSGTGGSVSCVKTASGQSTAWGNFHSGTYVGGMEYTDTATIFATSSDVRMKKDIVAASDVSAKIDQIRIVSHGWKHSNETVEYGTIAQELYEVAPQAVTKGDDGATVEKAWGVDYSKLVPMLIKEVQALRQRVATLEAQ